MSVAGQNPILPSFTELDQQLGTAETFAEAQKDKRPFNSTESWTIGPGSGGTEKTMQLQSVDAESRGIYLEQQYQYHRKPGSWFSFGPYYPHRDHQAMYMLCPQAQQIRHDEEWQPLRPSQIETIGSSIHENPLSGPGGEDDIDDWCEQALDAVRHLRKPSSRLLHKDAENFRRRFHASMLSGLRQCSLDVAVQLDANQIDQFERFLPLELIREKDALNNKRGDTKNLSYIAALIKIMSLKELVQKQRALIGKLDSRARGLSFGKSDQERQCKRSLFGSGLDPNRPYSEVYEEGMGQNELANSKQSTLQTPPLTCSPGLIFSPGNPLAGARL